MFFLFTTCYTLEFYCFYGSFYEELVIFNNARFFGKLYIDSASFFVPHSGHSILYFWWLFITLALKVEDIHFSHSVWPHDIRILGIWFSD
jgi:hypothetical protein